MAAPIGNKNATKARPWSDAINRALRAEDGKKLRQLADKLIERALEGDIPALREIGDRVEGKPAQSVELSGSVGKAADLTDEELVLIAHGSGSTPA